jgi:uncharacterized phage protein (TIGR01671 family)
MRKIKFRGKNNKTAEWLYGGSIFYQPEKLNVPPYIFDPNDCWISIDPQTIGQFTGFVDKNGKEIYEDDIIQLINEVGDKILVTCEFGHAYRKLNGRLCDIVGFYFILPNGKKSFPICNNYLGKHDTQIFKVVGNIHDNPDLITNQ